jgi:hypothetical protein
MWKKVACFGDDDFRVTSCDLGTPQIATGVSKTPPSGPPGDRDGGSGIGGSRACVRALRACAHARGPVKPSGWGSPDPTPLRWSRVCIYKRARVCARVCARALARARRVRARVYARARERVRARVHARAFTLSQTHTNMW